MSEMHQEALFRDALKLLVSKIAVDESRIGVEFPYVTDQSGEWQVMPASVSAGYTDDGWTHGNWFCGFWVGLLTAAYLHGSEDRLLTIALERMKLVASRATDPNTHDVGFIFWSSALPLLSVTGRPEFGDIAVVAANQLRRRTILTPLGAYISSWGPLDDERGRKSSAIDTMANLPLLYWAGLRTGDASFILAGEAHARMTRLAMVRGDWTTYHAVEYDPATGERDRGYTFQGYSDESCWSRGQAWAAYGYAATAGATGNVEYLNWAENIVNRYFELLGEDLLPPWDFDDPRGKNAPRDSSSAAVMAAALLQLAELDGRVDASERWRTLAYRMLEALCEQSLATEPDHRGLLKHGVYSMPQAIGTDSAVLFGDYYFVEAIMRILKRGAFVPTAKAITRGPD